MNKIRKIYNWILSGLKVVVQAIRTYILLIGDANNSASEKVFQCDTFSGLIYFTVESDSDNHPWFLSFFATSMRNPTEPHCFQLKLSASNLDFTVSDISRR